MALRLSGRVVMSRDELVPAIGSPVVDADSAHGLCLHKAFPCRRLCWRGISGRKGIAGSNQSCRTNGIVCVEAFEHIGTEPA